MIKLVRRMMLLTIAVSLISLLFLLTREIHAMNTTIQEFDDLVRRGNRYATLQTQDIDIVKQKLVGTGADSRSISAYRTWLNALENYRGFQGMKVSPTGGYLAPGTTTGEGASDPLLVDSIIPFLKEDLNSGDSKGYTPLNFGMTYLDPVLLQQDMTDYLKTSIRTLSSGTTHGTWGHYRVDPETITVSVTLNMTPFNIESLLNSGNADSQRAFIQMFGLDVNDSDTARLIGVTPGENNKIKTVIRYDITYDIKWDYIPYTFITKVPSRVYKAGNFDSRNPPEDIYFPWLYTEDGSLNDNPDVWFKDGRYKMLLPKPVAYEFSYVLTH